MTQQEQQDLSELNRAIGRVEGSLTLLVDKIDTAFTRVDTRLDTHSNRISDLEKWKSRAIGYFAGVGAVLMAIWKLLGLGNLGHNGR